MVVYILQDSELPCDFVGRERIIKLTSTPRLKKYRKVLISAKK